MAFAIKHIIEIAEPVRPPPAKSPQKREGTRHTEDPTPAALLVGTLLLCIFYAKHQIEVVTAFAGFNTFILFIIFFNVAFGINNNIIHDHHWKRYLYTTSLLALLGYPLMYIALNPVYAPLEIQNFRSAAAISGAVNMYKTFGLKGIGFLIFQVLGFLSLAIAMILQVLSLTFYTAVIRLVITDAKRPIVRFIAKITSRFRNPYKMMFISTGLYIFSFVLISGIGYEWWYSVASDHAA
jgi:hypothetical protein